jgi:hypothetical protein
MINSFSYGFGFQFKIHWTLRFLATLIGLALMPAIFFLGVIIVYFIWSFKEYRWTDVFCKFHKMPRWKRIVLSPCLIIWWFILLCVVIISAAVATALGVVPAYVFIITIFIISFSRFFCGSKKNNQTEE